MKERLGPIINEMRKKIVNKFSAQPTSSVEDTNSCLAYYDEQGNFRFATYNSLVDSASISEQLHNEGNTLIGNMPLSEAKERSRLIAENEQRKNSSRFDR